MAPAGSLATGNEPNPLDKTGLCLLALDGGGVRGLSTLYILKGLMQRLNYERQKDGLPEVKPCDVFDLIGGTSTGGLIAIMLGRLEMTVEACIDAYKKLMKVVFEDRKGKLPVGLLGKTKARFASNKLHGAIKEVVERSGASVDDRFDDGRQRGCRVFVCSTAHETAGITRLRSYPLPSKLNVSATVCEAALATSSATGYFDPVRIGVRTFVDGALKANNPVEEVEEEAADIWCSDSRDLQPLVKCFVSIGTGNPGKRAIEDNMLKFMSKTLVKLATETEQTEARMIARWSRLSNEKRYFRLNVEQGLQEVGLAEYKEQGLIEAATEEYLGHPQQNTRVKDCVMNLKEKQNFTYTAFEAVMKEYTIHLIKLQSRSRVFCNIPFDRNLRFVGRDDQLEELLRWFLRSPTSGKVAVTGLGGVGKTQVALELAYRIREEASDCSIFWIPAVSREGLEQTYDDIVRELRIPGWDAKDANSKILLQRHLSQQNSGRWLLIYDNADDLEMWLGKDGQQDSLIERLPRSEKGRIVFTTRDRKTAVKLAHQDIILVTDPDEDMALRLLWRYLIRKETTGQLQEAMALLEELAFLPLAIVQAAAYINENDISLGKYLELLTDQEEHLVDLLSSAFEDEGRYRGAKNPVTTTWLISFEQIRLRAPLASDYLSFMACIERTDVPQSMLPAGESRLQETNAIGLLKAYSFVTEKSTMRTLDLHRLVWLAMRSWLRKEKEMDPWIIKTLQHLLVVYPDKDNSFRSIRKFYIRHARQALNYKFQSLNDVEVYAESYLQLLWDFAHSLYQDERFQEAEYRFVQILDRRKRVLGTEHPSTLACMSNLALTYRAQGQWKKAEEVQAEELQICSRILGEDHVSTLSSKTNLASTYFLQGRWGDAERLQAGALEICRRMLGEKGPVTLTSTSNLASIYVSQGRWKEALELQGRLMETCISTRGEEHPDTLLSMANLVVNFMNQDRLQEAEELQARELAIRVRTRGAEHPSTAASMGNLASVYWNQRRWKEAEALELQVMQFRKKTLGEEHPDTLVSISNLAATLSGQGRWKEAEELEVHLVQTKSGVLGQRHPSTLTSMANLAITLRGKGRDRQAIELMDECVELANSILGTTHPDTSFLLETSHGWKGDLLGTTFGRSQTCQEQAERLRASRL